MASTYPLEGSEKETWNSGGTAAILPRERAQATFDVKLMSEAVYGGADAVKRRKFILMPAAQMVYPDVHEWSREKTMSTSIKDFIDIHKDFILEGYRPKRDEVGWMGENAKLTGSLMPHAGLFLSTILGQGSNEQIMAWLPRAVSFGIIGCYSQTELSHGSNIRALRTTATYDRNTEEFVLNTPTLGATKWWNSNIGKVATHAAVYAQLIIDNKEYGLHVFFVQIRDENHELLPGIEAGDCGLKLGDNAIDTGYLRLDNVRIPREHLFAKRQHVEPDGTYVRHEKSLDPAQATLAKRASYLTMMQARAGMTSLAAGRLGIACTVAIRYSCVRQQGFVDTREGQSAFSAEKQVIDYQVQRYRLFKQLAISYCMRASGRWMNDAIEVLAAAANTLESNANAEALFKAMPETHASSAGLKALCCKIAADGMEDLRKCCGGHGYLLSSGIGALAANFVWQVSAEGDFIVLLLQTARFLIKARKDAIAGKELPGLALCLEPLKRPDFKLESAIPKTPSTIEQVKSLQFLLSMFQYRTLYMVTRVGSKLDAKLSRGKSFEEAWNESAVGLKAAAECHIYFFMLRNFMEMIRKEKDEHVSAALQDLCALFALQNILDGEHWGGIVSSQLMDLVETAVEQLLDSIRPNAIAYVDAFDIPDRLLGDLGASDGNVYERLFESARTSALNRSSGPFEGYHEVLAPHLDMDFLSLRNKVCDDLRSSDAPSKEQLNAAALSKI